MQTTFKPVRLELQPRGTRLVCMQTTSKVFPKYDQYRCCVQRMQIELMIMAVNQISYPEQSLIPSIWAKPETPSPRLLINGHAIRSNAMYLFLVLLCCPAMLVSSNIVPASQMLLDRKKSLNNVILTPRKERETAPGYWTISWAHYLKS